MEDFATRTIREWFNELPSGYRELALENMISPDAQVTQMSYAITNGISWINATHGYNFWNALYEYYLFNGTNYTSNPLPPLHDFIWNSITV